jgi:hypothetical protein
MTKSRRTYLTAYLRAWRKAHPGYHLAKTHEYRRFGRVKAVRILGVRVCPVLKGLPR